MNIIIKQEKIGIYSGDIIIPINKKVTEMKKFNKKFMDIKKPWNKN